MLDEKQKSLLSVDDNGDLLSRYLAVLENCHAVSVSAEMQRLVRSLYCSEMLSESQFSVSPYLVARICVVHGRRRLLCVDTPTGAIHLADRRDEAILKALCAGSKTGNALATSPEVLRYFKDSSGFDAALKSLCRRGLVFVCDAPPEAVEAHRFGECGAPNDEGRADESGAGASDLIQLSM